MNNYNLMLQEIYKIQDQDANGNLDEDEMRICVSELLQAMQMNLDKIVDNI